MSEQIAAASTIGEAENRCLQTSQRFSDTEGLVAFSSSSVGPVQRGPADGHPGIGVVGPSLGAKRAR